MENGFVKPGVFDDSYTDYGRTKVYVDLIELADHRFIDGVPIQEFHSETEWRPLPKGWTYNTELFKLEHRIPQNEQERVKELFLNNREDVEKGLSEGVLVLAKTVFHGVVEAEIDRHKGFRVVKKYPAWWYNYGKMNPGYRCLDAGEVFRSWDGAKAHLQKMEEDRAKELALTDEEWSIREIESILKRVRDDGYRERCRGFLMNLPDLWDVEIKKFDETVLWRYFEKRTAWKHIQKGC